MRLHDGVEADAEGGMRLPDGVEADAEAAAGQANVESSSSQSYVSGSLESIEEARNCSIAVSPAIDQHHGRLPVGRMCRHLFISAHGGVRQNRWHTVLPLRKKERG